MDDFLKACMAHIELTASRIDKRQREQFLQLIPKFADGIAQMEIVGPKGEPSGPVVIPLEGTGLGITYSPKIIFGQTPSDPDATTKVKCPNCKHVISVTLKL